MIDWAAVRTRWQAMQPPQLLPPPKSRDPLWEAVVATARASNAAPGAMGEDEAPAILGPDLSEGE